MTPRPTKLSVARDAWGAHLPDWIARLAEAIDQASQNEIARRLGYSASALSQVVSRKYPTDMSSIEERVRGLLMREVVDCPGLGEIDLSACQDWRRKSREFKAHNPMRVRMMRACQSCPLNKRGAKQ